MDFYNAIMCIPHIHYCTRFVFNGVTGSTEAPKLTGTHSGWSTHTICSLSHTQTYTTILFDPVWPGWRHQPVSADVLGLVIRQSPWEQSTPVVCTCVQWNPFELNGRVKATFTANSDSWKTFLPPERVTVTLLAHQDAQYNTRPWNATS